MKKKLNAKNLGMGFKFDLKMKISLLFIFVAVFSIQASTYSQKTKISLNVEDSSIQRIIDEIEAVSEFKFMYETDAVDLTRKMTLKVRGLKIEKILKRLFLETDTSFKIRDRKIILVKNQKIEKEPKVVVEAPIQQQITGTVVDSNGQPLPGASIVEKGTTNGTQSDFDGNFQLNVASENAVLIISYIGFSTKEIDVNGQSTINVTLQEDAANLDEVVVVGYGVQRKADVTGSVSQVGVEELQSRPVPSFAGALQGRAAGVNITETGGNLDGRFNIRIRGVGSVTGSSDPLIIVDGVPLFNVGSFSTINPKDIVDITILKDASATAIYGSRASNGVVIVTTRRGEAGKAILTASVNVGIEEIANPYDVLSTQEQRQLFVEAFEHSNRDNSAFLDPNDPIFQIDNDWQDLATRSGIRKEYNVGVSGGSEKNTYAFSATMLDREGTLLNTDLKSWNLRANIDSKITERLKIATSISAFHQRQNVVNNDSYFGGAYRSLTTNHSYTPAFDEDGNLAGESRTSNPFFGDNFNPLVGILLPVRERNLTRIIGNTRIDYEILNGLKLSGNLGGDILINNNRDFFPVHDISVRNRRALGSVTEARIQRINWLAEAFLEYTKSFGKHNTKVLIGASVQEFDRDDVSVTGTGTINNSLDQIANQTDYNAGSFAVISGLNSTFARLNYDYDGKYLLTGTVRRDGSSRFGPENRYGVFPSGSVAWRISKENFMNDINFINDLKFRASYGLTGNQNINDFEFITRAGATNTVFGDAQVVGNSPVNIGNQALQWESAKQLDIGMDASFLGGRLNIEVDYYDKKSEDLLLRPAIPLTAGVGQRPLINLGSVQNKGVEFSFNSINVRSENFSWATDFNITYNENKVLDIGENGIGEPLILEGDRIPLPNEPINRTEAGRPIGAFHMYIFDGIWQLGEEAEAEAWRPGTVPGAAKYRDINGNGIFDTGDRTYTGTNPHPKFFGGLNNTFTYKNLSLSVFMNYATGYQLFNSARNFSARSVPFIQNLGEVRNRWTPTNPSNTIPRASQGGPTTFLSTRTSTRFLEDADFLRIKSIGLTYNLLTDIIQKIGFQSAKLSLTGINLFTITNYTGLDPEASSAGNFLSLGVDHTPYPFVKTVTMGLDVSF
ncbi:TonB-dependent receptor [Flagellimonas onchidii]|uniref:TonB-dependent receptor n=1 Tax=Flagellimonas onchidii TaxID=2562684 RepID=UPI0010A6B662|nr:TonB-dependent receptor [Allomuricauda onchidii]